MVNHRRWKPNLQASINDLQLAKHQLLTFEHGPSNVLVSLFHAQQRVNPGAVMSRVNEAL